MADITIADYGTVTTAAAGTDQTKKVATTANNIFTATFSSVTRTASPANSPANFNIADLSAPSTGSRAAERGLLYGRRPHRGLLFPRGYYNK